MGDRTDPAESAFLEAEVRRALEPYEGLLSADDLALLREELLDGLRADPALVALAGAARPREVDESGELPKERLTASAPGRRRGGGA